MATTIKRGYRYPSQGGEPDAAGDIQKLAEDVANDTDKLFNALPAKMAHGTDSISIAAGVASATKVITLPAGFTLPPAVILQNTANVAGRASLLALYAQNTTKDQFTVKIQTSDNANIGTSFAIAFNWIAAGS